MRHLFVALMMTVVAASVSVAKDTPFPIEAAQGTWQAASHATQLRIEIVDRDKDKVLVQMMAKTARGQVAVGRTVFERKQKNLAITLIYPDGKHLAITLKAQYVSQAGSSKPVLQLHMDMIELDSPGHSVVPSSLIKISN